MAKYRFTEKENFHYVPEGENLIGRISNEGIVIRVALTYPKWDLGIRFAGENFPYFEELMDMEAYKDQFRDLRITSSIQPFKENVFIKDISLIGGHFENPTLIYQHAIELNHNNLALSEKSIIKDQEIEIVLKYMLQSRELYISYSDADGIRFDQLIQMGASFLTFRLFTYDLNILESAKVELYPFVNFQEDISAFKIGNIIVRKGDMFNSDAVLNSNVILIPASDLGTVSSALNLRVRELSLPRMKKPESGEIELYQISKQDNIFAGYAYSVKEETSNIVIIAQICQNLLAFIRENLSDGPKKLKGINLPLLGTGAGGLDPLAVLNIYEEFFSMEHSGLPIIVSIPSAEVFERLRQAKSEQAIPLLHRFQNEKPIIISEIEQSLNIEIPYTNFEIDYRGKLTKLDLQHQQIRIGTEILLKLGTLQNLGLNYAEITDLGFLEKLIYLKHLQMKGLSIGEGEFLKTLTKLETLDISFHKGRLSDSVFQKIGKLKKLGLAGNGISNIMFLSEMNSLESLDLSQNRITSLLLISTLSSLQELVLADNLISDLKPLLPLKKLLYLDISQNKLLNFGPPAIFNRLNYLRADKNPFISNADLILSENGNHLGTIQNYLSRQAEKKKKPIRLPAKVLLLGNHASGKSSLLQYIQTEKFSNKIDSTHIINIERFPANSSQLPSAIFYDFGGQDYYHGIYRAFLSGGAINLLLWNAKHNENRIRVDSKNRTTQDFSLDYWLAQQHYLEVEQFDSVTSPTLLIQTHSDSTMKSSYKPEVHTQFIENDFFVSLSNKVGMGSKSREEVQKKGLKYLKASILALIEENQIQREEPQWYIDFLIYIIRENSRADYRGRKITDLLKHYNSGTVNRLDALKEDLEQLHRQGLILYYKEHIPDMVWLNPVTLVKHVHQNLLNTEVIEHSQGLIPLSTFDEEEKNVIELLIKQKVLFIHEATQQYIIPNFLPLAKKATAEFELYTFGLGEPIFTLKFKNFLPFGLINQIICFFGDLPEEKKFWRDRLIFTLDSKAKVLINIDFQKLSIQVYASYISGTQSSEKNEITKFLFYGILGLYWNQDLLKFRDFIAFINGGLKLEAFDPEDPIFVRILNTENLYENPACRPLDLFISLNQRDFINYNDLCGVGASVMINSVSVDKTGNFDGQNRAITVFPFQPFTRTDLQRRKNVAISYSKKDLILVNKFKDFLMPLYDDELINHPWYCTELIAGTDWDEEIQKKFDQADIIFFMISENLMSTKYVMENEVKNAIDKYNRGVPIKIVPILMVPYHFARKGDYNLSRFSALPYTLEPVILFKQQSEAWHIVSECIRIMIEKDLDPGRGDELPAELKSYFEKIIKRKHKRK